MTYEIDIWGRSVGLTQARSNYSRTSIIQTPVIRTLNHLDESQCYLCLNRITICCEYNYLCHEYNYIL